MNAEVFADWLRRQGQHVVRTASSYWHSQGPRAYQAFPYHWTIHPSEDELLEFLHANRAIALRYSTTLDAQAGLLSYHAVCDDSTYDMGKLSSGLRNNVRRGLKNCTVERVPFERLAGEGLALQVDTIRRQGGHRDSSADAWQKFCLAASDLPGFEAWGAIVGRSLAASLIAFRTEDCCCILSQQSLRKYLPLKVNNALTYVVTHTMVRTTSLHSVFYGLHSLDAPPSVDEFKFLMGYKAKPVRQRVVFHPWLAPFINHGSHSIVRRLQTLRPANPTLAKGEGIIRFYLEGKRPISKQVLPEPMRVLDLEDLTSLRP
jgi:hypothetical protein